MEHKVESNIKEIAYSQEIVYNTLSDLNHISKIQSMIPAEYAKDLTFDKDSVSISVAAIGSVSLQIVEREEPKTIKFEAVKSPVPLTLWVQILPTNETSCKMKLTAKAELNFMMKAIVGNKLQKGIDEVADRLAQIKYE